MFSQVDGGQWDPREMGRHKITLKIDFHYEKVDFLSLLYIYNGRHVLLGHFEN